MRNQIDADDDIYTVVDVVVKHLKYIDGKELYEKCLTSTATAWQRGY